MVGKKIINDRQRARKVYGFVQRLPDRVYAEDTAAVGDASVLKLDWKESVRCASTANITLPPGSITGPIDGVTLVDGERFLLKDQTTSSEKGIYVVDIAAGIWKRATDAVPATTLTCGATCYVESGTTNGQTKWLLQTVGVTLGGPQVWVPFDASSLWFTNGSEIRTPYPAYVGAGVNYPSDFGTDVFFYVSGSRGCPDPADQNVSVFGGDLVVSGALNLVPGDGMYGNWMEISGTLVITTGSIKTQNADTGDYTFFVCSDTGQTEISGNLGVTGSIQAIDGLSGSLTQLVDGTSYLIAGSNITITSQSNGSVIITSTGGGGGGAAGSIYEVQYNDGFGVLAASPNFTFNFSTNVLNTRTILPNSDSSYNLGSPSFRWANVYTGDLHLRNEKGDWTLIEDEDALLLRNNRTEKFFKFVIEPVDDPEDP
jgi:hypothetical protein